MSLISFNKELLSDRLGECQANLERALEQHRLLSEQLYSIKVRFQRAVSQGKRTFSYKYSMQMSCISGTMCMYENYMRRKAEQIRKLKRFQWHLDRTTTSSSSPSTSGLEGNSDTSNSTQCKEQKRSQSTEATDRTVTTDNIDQATSSKDCTSVCSDRRTRTSVSSSRKRKYEATVRSSENKSSSQKVYPESHAPQNSSKRNV